MSTCDEDHAVYNGHFELEILIERPVELVWKRFVDIGSWITSHDIENVYGTPGAVGSIMRVSGTAPEEQEMPRPHYHYCKIIKLVPERQYVLKTYSERGGSYGMEIAAFDDTRFVGAEDGTKLIFNLYAEIRAEAVAREPTRMNLDDSKEGMLKNLKNLKRIVESY